MKLGHEGLAIFNEIAECGSANVSNLSEWQQEFLSSYAEKVEKWGDGCFITSKQLVQINKMAEALGCEMISEEVLDND